MVITTRGITTITGTVPTTGTAIIGAGTTTIGIIPGIIITIITTITTTMVMAMVMAVTTTSPTMWQQCVATTPLDR